MEDLVHMSQLYPAQENKFKHDVTTKEQTFDLLPWK